MLTINCKGLLCPRPLIEAKKAFTQARVGETITILVDNETAVFNLTSYFNGNGVQSQTQKENDLFLVTVIKGITNQAIIETSKPEDYCNISNAEKAKGNTVIAVASDKMGDGDPELGTILMKGFFVALAEADMLPKEVVFYNSGVLLTRNDSGIIHSLQQLKANGVIITACGTCADFYNIKSEIGIATISNMYSILNVLNAADKVIKP